MIIALTLLQQRSLAQSVDAWRAFGDAGLFLPECDTVALVIAEGDTTVRQRYIRNDTLKREETIFLSGTGKVLYRSRYDTLLISWSPAVKKFRITETVNDSVTLSYTLQVAITKNAVRYQSVSATGKPMNTTTVRTNRRGRTVSSRTEGNGMILEQRFTYRQDTLLTAYKAYMTSSGQRYQVGDASFTYAFGSPDRRLLHATKSELNDLRGQRTEYSYSYEEGRLIAVAISYILIYPYIDAGESYTRLSIRYEKDGDRVLIIHHTYDEGKPDSEIHISCK